MITRRNLAKASLGAGAALLARNALAQVATLGYIVGDWYPPQSAVQGAGVALTAGTIYLRPVLVSGAGGFSIDTLGANLTTASAGGNFQMAAYNMGDGATPHVNRPGTLLSSTASVSTATVGSLSGTLATGQFLGSGSFYWMALQVDNTTAKFRSYSNSDPMTAWMIGSATLGDVVGSSLLTGIRTTGTFGTWPADISGSTFTESTVNETPVVAFHVSCLCRIKQ